MGPERDPGSGFEGHEPAVTDLFTATFAASDGEGEGRVVGAVAFTRLTYPQDPHRVVRLAPMR